MAGTVLLQPWWAGAIVGELGRSRNLAWECCPRPSHQLRFHSVCAQVAILELLAATAAGARRDKEAGPRKAILAAVSTVALVGLPAVAKRLRGECRVLQTWLLCTAQLHCCTTCWPRSITCTI